MPCGSYVPDRAFKIYVDFTSQAGPTVIRPNSYFNDFLWIFDLRS